MLLDTFRVIKRKKTKNPDCQYLPTKTGSLFLAITDNVTHAKQHTKNMTTTKRNHALKHITETEIFSFFRSSIYNRPQNRQKKKKAHNFLRAQI